VDTLALVGSRGGGFRLDISALAASRGGDCVVVALGLVGSGAGGGGFGVDNFGLIGSSGGGFVVDTSSLVGATGGGGGGGFVAEASGLVGSRGDFFVTDTLDLVGLEGLLRLVSGSRELREGARLFAAFSAGIALSFSGPLFRAVFECSTFPGGTCFSVPAALTERDDPRSF